MKIIKEIIPYIVILIVVILVRMYLITPITVVGSSMDPTLHDKQMLILSKISYKIHDIERFDIIVIRDTDGDLIQYLHVGNEWVPIGGTKGLVEEIEDKDINDMFTGWF